MGESLIPKIYTQPTVNLPNIPIQSSFISQVKSLQPHLPQIRGTNSVFLTQFMPRTSMSTSLTTFQKQTPLKFGDKIPYKIKLSTNTSLNNQPKQNASILNKSELYQIMQEIENLKKQGYIPEEQAEKLKLEFMCNYLFGKDNEIFRKSINKLKEQHEKIENDTSLTEEQKVIRIDKLLDSFETENKLLKDFFNLQTNNTDDETSVKQKVLISELNKILNTLNIPMSLKDSDSHSIQGFGLPQEFVYIFEKFDEKNFHLLPIALTILFSKNLYNINTIEEKAKIISTLTDNEILAQNPNFVKTILLYTDLDCRTKNDILNSPSQKHIDTIEQYFGQNNISEDILLALSTQEKPDIEIAQNLLKEIGIIKNKNISDMFNFCVKDTDSNNLDFVKKYVLNNELIESGRLETIMRSIKNADINNEDIKNSIIKILTSKSINSCDKAKMINSINDDNISYLEEILKCIDIPSKYKTAIFEILNYENIERARKIINNKNISYDKKDLCIRFSNNNNLDWLEKLSQYKSNAFVFAEFETQGASFFSDIQEYHKRTIEYLNGQCSIKQIVELMNVDEQKKTFLERNLNAAFENPLFENYPYSYPSNVQELNPLIYDDNSKSSIVKEFPEHTSKSEILKETELGDVVQLNNQIYINEGNKLSKWNISKEAVDKLFPPVKRFQFIQKNIGDCGLLAKLIGLMNHPLGRIYLYKCFSQEGHDILCTINPYINFIGKGTRRYKNGELPDIEQ